jgi:uncharacterized phage protein gp47/JayE
MPWFTPTLKQVRELTRDNVAGLLATVAIPKNILLASLNRQASIGNSVLRVMSDAMAGLAHLTLKYIDWLSLQFLPDTSETEWLDRHGAIWLKNADGSVGRKTASYASGTVTITGQAGTVCPTGALLNAPGGAVGYETTQQVFVSGTGTPVPVRALDPGVVGNLLTGDILSFVPVINGINQNATAVNIIGGTDTETDDELRARVLKRIQQPPMGGDATDFEQWALAVDGVTRAWCSPLELGMGTVVIRFCCDDLRADNNGIPLAEDVLRVSTYIDSVRPVAVKDVYCVAPIPFPINLGITAMVNDSSSTRQSVEESLRDMILEKAVPGGVIYRSWVDYAVSDALGEVHHELTFTTVTPPTPGHLPILGSISYAG